MGNANGGSNRPDSAQNDMSDSSRNPLQRNSNTSSPTYNGSGSPKRGQRQSISVSRNAGDEDGRGGPSSTFTLPQPPPGSSALQSVQVGNGGDNARARRVSVAVTGEEDPPHQTPQRLAGFRRLSTTESLGSANGSLTSHQSSLNGKPRLTISEAREILLSIFFPRQGQLECVTSGFLTLENYALMRGFWTPFLNTDLRDKWYLDAVMLSVLGKDRWRSSRQQQEIIMSVSPSREQVLQLNQQRREYSDQLRERLLDLCGSLVESQEHHAKKTNLQSLLEEYNRVKDGNPSLSASREGGFGNGGGGGGGREHERMLSRTSSEATSSMQHQDLLSLSMMRLQTTVSTSFDCFDLLASRVPTSIISSLPSHYFLNTTPVVYDKIAFQEKKVGDIDTMSFFMSLEARRRLLNGQSPDDTDRLLNQGDNDATFAQSFNGYDMHNTEHALGSARQLYSAVRHAGLVVTTACSSMILTVMFQLAEVLRARQTFRDNRVKAAQKGITLEQLIGKKEATIRTYSGKPTDDLEELKRYAITDEMSLAVLTKLLVERFRKDNRAKMEKLRKKYPNLFAYLEAIAPKEEQEDFDVTRLLSGMVLKLMFLTGGGQRSIVADDRRVPAGLHQTTDDVAISNMLEVPILNRICWMACMMGMPIMSNHGILAQKHQGKPMSFKELDECCGVMRKLFQAVGALPCGDACPHAFKEWFPLFPFYAVNAEGKRILMYLYMAQVSAIQRVPLTIQKDMTLLSFAAAFQAAKGHGRVDIANYFFDPKLTVGYARKDKDGEVNSTSVSAMASPLAPKSVASATLPSIVANSNSKRSIDSARSDRASPLTNSVNGSAAAKVMPASLNPGAVGQQQSGPAGGGDRFQYMTAVVSPGSPSALPTSKTSPSKAARGSCGTPRAAQPKSLTEDALSCSSSSASLSCSTLLDDGRDIDVYTCVNPQTQLYMRCSNEATTRRHRATELTPSVVATYLHSAHEVHSRRPDIAAALHQAVPKLMPSEGFLVVRWTTADPLVTFCPGDIISVMAERVTSSSGGSNNAAGAGSNGGGAVSPTANGGSGQQQRVGSARYFTGAVRPSLDGTAGGIEAAGNSTSTSRGANGLSAVDDGAGGRSATTASPRVHTVTIDDSSLPPSNMARANNNTNTTNTTATTNNSADVPFAGYGVSGNYDDDFASSSSGSFNAPEKTRMYQGLMHEFLGVKEKVGRRLAVRWNVVDVLPSSQLLHRTRRLSAAAAASPSASSTNSKQQQQQEQYRNEVVLHVAAAEMPVSIPLRVLTIGHERAAMSVFTFVSPDNDSVCWANPRLVESIVNRGGSSSSGGGGNGGTASMNASASASVNFLQGSTSQRGPSGVLCNTEEELHNVFFSIGVLLSNAIVNGVYFSAPIAPLAFLLMKKALSSGDYSFKSFMWLEPADGNLLSPALVLNSAYEILTMSEQQYVTFLESRGLARKDAHIFPVMHSLADEMKEDRLWESMAGNSAGPHDSPRSRSQSQASGGKPLHMQGSGDSSSMTTNSAARDRSLNGSHVSSNTLEYMKMIQLHNRRGSTFRRSQALPAIGPGGGGGGGGFGGFGGANAMVHNGSSVSANQNGNNAMAHNFLMSGNVPVQDRLQGYRNQQKDDTQPLGSDVPNLETLYSKLPSRREYLNLYLVNDLAWGSVKRDGVGEKNKELWVSMARGFMTSALAKSPLLSNCCSRIIREVLCVPRPDD